MTPSYAEKIPANHLVRVVHEAIDKMDVNFLLAKYNHRIQIGFELREYRQKAGETARRARQHHETTGLD